MRKKLISKLMSRHELIAYAMDFSSFLLKSSVAEKINKIILFGSVARGDFDQESDIDLFIDCSKDKKVENQIQKVLRLFELSETNEKWKIKGLKNTLSLKIGNLEKWALRRDVISSGMLLYGKYAEMPKGMKYYLMFKLNFESLKRGIKVNIWRRLYGYRQKVGTKEYISKGLLGRVRGKKIEKSVIIVPVENKDKILDFLKKYKIKYEINEIWSDTL